MNAHSEKVDVMMSAKLLADIDAAPILSTSLVRGAVDAAKKFTKWVSHTDLTLEMTNASAIALRRLRNTEKKAREIESDPVEEEVLKSLHVAINELSLALRKRTRSRADDGSDQEYDDLSDTFESEAMNEEAREGRKHQVPKDVERAVWKAAWHSYVLLFVLLVVITVSALVIIMVNRSAYYEKVDEIEKSITMDLALVAQQALAVLHPLVTSTDTVLTLSPVQIAASLLSDMTASSVTSASSQEIATSSAGYLTEFRAAQLKFGVNNRVSAVITEREYSGLCQTNETHLIQPINDIYSNQTWVITMLSPEKCGDDASASGAFALVTPTFLRYTAYVETYRRTHARLASFYDDLFEIGVAVTRDRKSIQEVLTPSETLIGNVEPIPSTTKKWQERLSLWCGIIIGVVVLLISAITVVALNSSLTYWRIIYSTVVGLVVCAALAVVLIVTQSVLGNAVNDALTISTSALADAIVNAYMSDMLQSYNLSSTFLQSLYSDIFKGRLILTNPTASKVIPSEMSKIASKIDMFSITSFRRGMYSVFQKGYVVSATYIDEEEESLLVVEKLTSPFHLDGTIAIVVGCGMIAGAIFYGYLFWSPLTRLRRYGVVSPVFRYLMHASSARFVLYGLVILLPIAGMIGVNCFGVQQVHYQQTNLAQDSLGLLGASLRASSIAKTCEYGCGTPNFILMLYFRLQNGEANFMSADLPIPYPNTGTWENTYLGAQLAVNNLHTNILNTPCFATPLVNYTDNVTDPRFIARHMIEATGIDGDVSMAIERFPISYYPKMYNFICHSIGISLVLVVGAIIITVYEWQYINVHKRKQKNQSLCLPFTIMGVMIALILVAFLGHGLLMKMFIKEELIEFSHRELALLLAALNYRISLLTLEVVDRPQSEVLEQVINVTKEISTSAMLLGTTFLRVRTCFEYEKRGSGRVTIFDVPNEDTPVSIGSLDNGYIPVCGLIDGKFVGQYVTTDLNYCFVEVPQNVYEGANVRRIFLLVSSGYSSWLTTPMESIWPVFMGVAAVVGGTVTLLLLATVFLGLNTAHSAGFPLMKEGDVVSSTLLPNASIETFIPRRHRLRWLSALLLLGLFVLYFTVAVGDFLYTMLDNNSISLVYTSQTTLLGDLISQVTYDAYNYILYPIPKATIDLLPEINTDASAGALPYVFVTSEGLEAFETGVTNIYNNLTLTGGVFNDMLSVAADGYGSFTSYAAARYDTVYISAQKQVFEFLDSLSSQLSNDFDSGIIIDYTYAIQFVNQLLTVRELLKKLFVLDHVVISSYANVYADSFDDWPWSDDTDINDLISHALAAKTGLEALIIPALNTLSDLATKADPSSKDTLSYYIGEIQDLYISAYALASSSSQMWQLQSSRCNEAMSTSNETQSTLADEQQREKLNAISEQSSLWFGTTRDYEMSARKTYQLIDYFREGKPLEHQLPTQAWQRWADLISVQKMIYTAYICTAVGYIAICALMILHFKMLRIKTRIAQREAEAAAATTSQRKVSLSMTVSDKGIFGKPTPSAGDVNSKENSAINTMSPNSDMYQAKKLSTDSPLSKALASEEDSVVDTPVSAPILSSFQAPPKSRSVLVPLAVVFSLTLIPLTCAFWLITLAHSTAHSALSDISIVLSLYSKVTDLQKLLNDSLLQVAKYYLQLTSLSDVLAVQNNLVQAVQQLGGAYEWDTHRFNSYEVQQVYDTFQAAQGIFTSELQAYSRRLSPLEVPDYPTTQSYYGRTFLPTLASDNTYGSLIPVSASTDGCAVNQFATDAYNTALAGATAAASVSDFMKVYQTYMGEITALNSISDAELQMWHATIAGSRTNGAQVAADYSTFTSLVSAGSLSAISLSSEPSAAAAMSEVAAYFSELLTKAGTPSQVVELFKNSVDEPTPPATLTSDYAYFCAAYVTSTAYHIMTETKFANMYAYNRGLTNASADLSGKMSLIQAIEKCEDAVDLMLTSIGDSAIISVGPATENQWVWYKEILLAYNTTHDHKDLNYLSDAIRWCCIVSVWSIILSIFAAVYLTVHR